MRITGKESFSTTIHCSTFKWVSLKTICNRKIKVVASVRDIVKYKEQDEIKMRDLRAGGPHRWSWSGGTWRGSWQPLARDCSMEACATGTDSQTSYWEIHRNSENPYYHHQCQGKISSVAEPDNIVTSLASITPVNNIWSLGIVFRLWSILGTDLSELFLRPYLSCVFSFSLECVLFNLYAQ